MGYNHLRIFLTYVFSGSNTEYTEIPDEIVDIKKRIETVAKSSFDQITVNYYEAGEGIPPHVDNQMAFGEVIISLSLLSDCIMEFKRDENIFKMDLERRSLLIMGTESRYR